MSLTIIPASRPKTRIRSLLINMTGPPVGVVGDACSRSVHFIKRHRPEFVFLQAILRADKPLPDSACSEAVLLALFHLMDEALEIPRRLAVGRLHRKLLHNKARPSVAVGTTESGERVVMAINGDIPWLVMAVGRDGACSGAGHGADSERIQYTVPDNQEHRWIDAAGFLERRHAHRTRS